MLVAAFSISRRATMFAVRHPANKRCAVFFALSTTIMHLQGAEYRIFCVILLHVSDALVKL